MKRLVITGAESTGKSTLATNLARHYGEPCSIEFVRSYVDNLTRELKATDLEAIARGQVAVEDAATSTARHFSIHDTNLLSSIIYADYYFQTTINWVNEAFTHRNYDLYLLCMPDIPWVADAGQRESPQLRDQMHGLFQAQLDELRLPYVEISGSRDERLTQAIQAIESTITSLSFD